MTKAERVKAELARRELARRRLLYFTKQTHPSYEAGWVHADICLRLERFSKAVILKRSPRLLLLVPPRHGKSELASIRFPAWHVGHAPAHEIINVGYNLDLPMRFSRKVRELIRNPMYRALFPGTDLDPDTQAVEAWLTTAGGGYTAAGVGGGITGKGAHILLVDDPIKNQEEADSANIREQLWDWYMSTAYTRLAPGGGVLVIETWWNDDDLAGRLQAMMRADPNADQFEVVRYPAISEQYEYRNKDTLAIERTNEPLSSEDWELLRNPGEALHPERYDIAALNRIKSNLAPRIWSALYQQNPIPDEGLYFKKEQFQLYTHQPDPHHMNIFTGWDFAIGTKQQNDWNVGATLIQTPDDYFYLVDLRRFKGDSFSIVDTIVDVAEIWSQFEGVDYLMAVEDGQIWRSIKPLLEKRMSERKVFPAYEVMKPLTDKMARARALQGRMQQKRIWIPKESSYTDNVIQEMLRFPGGAHDDIVDATAWAVNLAITKGAPRVAGVYSPRIQVSSWKDKIASLIKGSGASHMSA